MARDATYPDVQTYTRMPKNVWADIAYSLAVRLAGEDDGAVRELLGEEWAALHTAGIIPQAPKMPAPYVCHVCGANGRATCHYCKQPVCRTHLADKDPLGAAYMCVACA